MGICNSKKVVNYKDDEEKKNEEENKNEASKKNDLANLALKSKDAKVQMLELIVKVNNLPSFDKFSAADPLIAFYVEEGGGWHYKAKTEGRQNQPNCVFTKTFTIAYYPDTVQRLKFELYDCDTFKDDIPLEKHFYVGCALFNLSDTLKIDTWQREIGNFNKGKNDGMLTRKKASLTVGGVEVNELNSNIGFQFACKDIDVRHKIFYKLEGARGEIDYVEVRQSIPIDNMRQEELTKFDPFTVSMTDLCGGDEYTNLRTVFC